MSYVLEVLPALLNGAVVTLQVFFIVIVLSIPLGIVLAFLMQIKFKPLNWLLTLYVWIMRGTPLLLQLIFVYYVLPSVGIVFDRLPAAILAFTLNYAAYFAEIFRGGILAIPKGQYEAAKMLKLSPFQTIRYIILPQVVKIVLPSIFNEIINLVKDSSLVYVLGVGDLLLESRTAANRDATLAPMFVAGAIYLILVVHRTRDFGNGKMRSVRFLSQRSMQPMVCSWWKTGLIFLRHPARQSCVMRSKRGEVHRTKQSFLQMEQKSCHICCRMRKQP